MSDLDSNMKRVSISNDALLLSRTDIEQCLDMAQTVSVVEEVFRAHGEGRIVMPAKIKLDMTSLGIPSWMSAMPAYVEPAGLYGLKFAGGFINNPSQHNLPFVMGSMTLRMRGVFFALATVAVSLALVQLSRHYVDLTGGADGLALKFIGNSLWAMQARSPTPFLYAGLAFVVAYYWITRWILSSSFGLEMQAVRDDEVAAAAAGVAVFRTKLLGFLLSAAMTSLAAVLYMQYYMAIDPEAAFGLSQAIQLQLPALLGGLGTALGPIVGGAVMVFLSEVTNWGSTKIGVEGLDILVYGLMLLVVILRAPNGIVGMVFKNAVAGGSR